jgi:O-acetyl-ADP-ribose deacetylase
LIAFPLPPLTIEIADGDIAVQAVDAIVNAANTAFWMGAGVAGAIKARGGEEIERDAVAQGPVGPGGCVLTGGGRLPAPHVIHAAVMGQDLVTSAAFIDRATRNALAMAGAHRFESIAIPALGTGVGGFPLDACARTMMGAVVSYVGGEPATSLRLVRVVLFGRRAYLAFVEAASARLGRASGEAPDCPLSS